jgi:uncharacterized protein (UPF0147 family)
MGDEEKLIPVISVLGQLADDNSVPRNIRRGAAGAKDSLTKPGQAIDVRVASAIFMLDELANDPNIPLHGRTLVWSIISQLESINAQFKK